MHYNCNPDTAILPCEWHLGYKLVQIVNLIIEYQGLIFIALVWVLAFLIVYFIHKYAHAI